MSLDAKEEIRRWKDKATMAAKRGKDIPDFECEYLPDAAIENIEKRLKAADSLGEVKAAFEFEIQDGVVAKDLSGKAYKATVTPAGAGMPLPNIPDAITFNDADADMTIWNETLPDYPGLLSADHINSDVTDLVLFGIPELSPWIWNGSTCTYAGLEGTLVEGKKVELDDMIQLRDEIMTALVKLSDGLAQSLAGGDLTVQEWLLRLRDLVKKAYLIEFVLARGGLRSLSRDDLGKLSTMIETQFWYMDILGMNVRDGKLTKAEIRGQAATFVESAIQAF